jgi:hypothetical protein
VLEGVTHRAVADVEPAIQLLVRQVGGPQE